MSILEIREEGTHKAAEEVVLDGNSFVASWPLEQAEALLADLTPWWMNLAHAGHAGDRSEGSIEAPGQWCVWVLPPSQTGESSESAAGAADPYILRPRTARWDLLPVST